MDVCETKENELTATIELPGMSKDDVSIDVHPNRLIISGQFTRSNQQEQNGYAVRERHFGKFTRTLPLPTGVKARVIVFVPYW